MVINTNLKGYFLIAQAVVPQMIERGYGKVINMSSILGAVGLPNQAAYASSFSLPLPLQTSSRARPFTLTADGPFGKGIGYGICL